MHNNLKTIDRLFRNWKTNVQLKKAVRPLLHRRNDKLILKGYFSLKRYADR